MNHAGAAATLHQARREGRAVPRLTDAWPDLSVNDAYRIQAEGIRLREADGETVIGAKLGFTSTAMQEAMGVTNPNFGWLTDEMLLEDGVVSLSRFIHPKLEPEIGFLLGDDLAGHAVTVGDVLAATAFVTPALEVVDSRFEGFRFRANDNTADNSSAGALVTGGCITDPASLDLARLGVVLTVNGAVRYTAAGAAVAGHPAASVAWLVRRLARDGTGLRAGQLVISGGLTGPTDLTAGREVTVDIDRLGSASLRVVD